MWNTINYNLCSMYLLFINPKSGVKGVSPPVGEVARSARGVDRQNKALTLCAPARSKTIQKR